MDVNWLDYPTLAESRERSLQALATLQSALKRELADLPEYPLIAASGSLGRLEIRPGSDCDLIIVIPEELVTSKIEAGDLSAAIHRAILETGLAPSDPAGIFAESIHARELSDPVHRGEITENLDRFGKRIQLLLDSRPVLRADKFRDLLFEILGFYGAGKHPLPQGEWSYLVSDIIRYYRTYTVWRQWDFRGGGWTLRNLKLNSSRLLMVAGLLMVLGESSRQTDPLQFVIGHLELSPLERITDVFQNYPDANPGAFLAEYESFQRQFFNPEIRSELAPGLPRSFEDFPLPETDWYHRLNAPLSRMRGQLVSFLLNRQSDWPGDFVSGLLL